MKWADVNLRAAIFTVYDTKNGLPLELPITKHLMNHTTGRDDVTAGYIILTAETLRQSAEKIQSYFFQRMTSPNVVEIACVAKG